MNTSLTSPESTIVNINERIARCSLRLKGAFVFLKPVSFCFYDDNPGSSLTGREDGGGAETSGR